MVEPGGHGDTCPTKFVSAHRNLAFHNQQLGRQKLCTTLTWGIFVLVTIYKELQKLLSSAALTENLCRRGVEWHFISRQTPWFGGFWERLIALTKSSLKKVLGQTHATLELYGQLFTEQLIYQRHTTKYILSDYTFSYKSRLINLSLLPLMCIFELNDLIFFIKSGPCNRCSHLPRQPIRIVL